MVKKQLARGDAVFSHQQSHRPGAEPLLYHGLDVKVGEDISVVHYERAIGALR